MKKGDTHFIVFTNNGELLHLTTIDDLFRHDIKLIIKRTFHKTSGGQGLYNYFNNEILDESKNVIEDKVFRWNKLSCKIFKDEYWGSYSGNNKFTSVVLGIEIKDHFDVAHNYIFPMCRKDSFIEIKNTFELLDRVGTHQAVVEIKELERKIVELKGQLKKL